MAEIKTSLFAVERMARGRITKSNRRLVRPVTARYMHGKEMAAYEAYEKESATAENR